MVVARSAWEIHDTRLLSDPSALPSCTSLGVWLAWYRADGHPLPGRAPGCRAGQMQHDAAHRAFDSHGHLEQPFAQREHLRLIAVRHLKGSHLVI